ncbi:MAG: hypothetical protein NTV32_04175 [Gammaproteobacteria bacterium]|nr:hypothetical protein [Gammaproteobacteria bacterium]
MNIQIRHTIKDAWALVKGSKRAFFTTFIAMALLQAALVCIQEEISLLGDKSNLSSPLITILMLLITSPLSAGFAMIGLKRARGESVKWKSGLVYFKKILPLFSAYFISMMAMWLGVIVILFVFFHLSQSFIMPHLLNAGFATRFSVLVIFALIGLLALSAINTLFSFNPLLILDEKKRSLQAVSKSIKLAWAHFKKLYGLVIILLCLNILGAIPFGLGLIWTIPLTYISIGLVYQKIHVKTPS